MVLGRIEDEEYMIRVKAYLKGGDEPHAEET